VDFVAVLVGLIGLCTLIGGFTIILRPEKRTPSFMLVVCFLGLTSAALALWLVSTDN
jgi:Co/Zn/Cd efflux system component